jgi:hypothetical protein
MKTGFPAAPSQAAAARPSRRTSAPVHALPLGTAVYDADVQHRAERLVSEIIEAFPDLESHDLRLQAIVERALKEQDHASRADEVLRRFSPSVQQYVRRHSVTRS